jgi:hypothetical protein
LLGRELHYYYGSPRLSFNKRPFDYAGWQEGKEYKTEAYDPQSGALLRVTQTQIKLADTNQISRKTYAYHQYGNRTDTYEYDLGTPNSGAPGSLTRRAHTDYVTGVNYVNVDPNPVLGAGLRSLPR